MSSLHRTMLRAIAREHPAIYDAKLKGKPIPNRKNRRRRFGFWKGVPLNPQTKKQQKELLQQHEAKALTAKKSTYWKDKAHLVSRVPGNIKQLAKEARAKANKERKSKAS